MGAPERIRHEGGAVATSPGVVIGRVQKLRRGRMPIPERHLASAAVEAEVERLDRAVMAALREMEHERRQLAVVESRDPQMILDAHIMMLSDPELVDRARERIREQAINAEWALRQQMDAIEQAFEQIEDEYLRARKDDVEQVGQRVLRHLAGEPADLHQPGAEGDDPQIFIAEDFTVSEVVALWRAGAAGLVAEQGGGGSHALILARGIGLPALVGVEGILDRARDGDTLILDGEQGRWVLNPEAEEQVRYRRFAEAIEVYHDQLMAYAGRPSRSADGHPLPIMGNLEFPEELDMALRVGVEGIGLFRTEFLFMNSGDPPDAATQAACYREVVRAMAGRPVTIRLLDVGGDKPQLYRCVGADPFNGMNPAMGLRGIRLLLRMPDLLRAQLRGIVAAAREGPVQVLVPMVVSVEEMQAVRRMLQDEIERAGGGVRVPLGAMIEVPAAVLIADELAKVSDFFSIGTNDLMQYALAADRADEEVAGLYRAEHPAIERLMRLTVQAAHRAGIPVSLCGELAADPEWTERLMNMGLDALSMSLHAVLVIRRHLSRLTYAPDNGVCA